MDLRQVKESFYSYLKQLNEPNIFILMNYLSLLIHDYNFNYSNFKSNTFRIYLFI